VPLSYHGQGLDREVIRHFDLPDKAPDLSDWARISDGISNPDSEVTIAIVGKYTSLQDSYKSLGEALVHGGIANSAKVRIEWIDSELFEKEDAAIEALHHVSGILVPGGLVSVARKEKSVPLNLPACIGFRISASVSACRWRCWKPRAIWPICRGPGRANSVSPKFRLLA
jgi:CTP synthase (UTP-ammonia lyase)